MLKWSHKRFHNICFDNNIHCTLTKFNVLTCAAIVAGVGRSCDSDRLMCFFSLSMFAVSCGLHDCPLWLTYSLIHSLTDCQTDGLIFLSTSLGLTVLGHYDQFHSPLQLFIFFNDTHTFHSHYHTCAIPWWWDEDLDVLRPTGQMMMSLRSQGMGLHDRAAWHASYHFVPVGPGPGPRSTCWPCGLILPLKSEVIAPDDTPIVASVSGWTATIEGLPIEPVTNHPGWRQWNSWWLWWDSNPPLPGSQSNALTTTLLRPAI